MNDDIDNGRAEFIQYINKTPLVHGNEDNLPEDEAQVFFDAQLPNDDEDEDMPMYAEANAPHNVTEEEAHFLFAEAGDSPSQSSSPKQVLSTTNFAPPAINPPPAIIPLVAEPKVQPKKKSRSQQPAVEQPQLTIVDSIIPPTIFGEFNAYLFDPPLPASTSRIIFFDGEARMGPQQKTAERGAAAVVVYENLMDEGWTKTYHQARILHNTIPQVAAHTGLLAGVKLAFLHKKATTAICGDHQNAILQVTRYNDVTNRDIVKLCHRSISMAKAAGDGITFHHFARDQHNPADTCCNEAMEKNASVDDTCGKRDHRGFAGIDDRSDEPKFRNTAKITRLYQRSERRTEEEMQLGDNTTHLDDLSVHDVFCQAPTFWKVDSHAIGLLASCLTRCITGVTSLDIKTKLEAWRRFFLLPQSKLQRPNIPGKRRILRERLVNQSLPTRNDEQVQQLDKSFETRQLNRATALASNSLLGKAARQLERENIPLPENSFELLKELHPRSDWRPPPSPDEPAFVSIDSEVLLRIMKKQSSLKSPGPSSWTEDLLYQACNFSPECLSLITVMVKDIVNNHILLEIRDILTACRICAIPKDGQAIRPIAIGEAIMKLSEAYVTEAVSEQVKDFIHPEQRALDDGGCEKTIHELRSAYKDGKAIVSLDATNAYNTLSREAIFKVADRFPIMKPLITLMYANPSHLLHKDGVIMSEVGTRQGGNSSSTIFCVAAAPAIKSTSQISPNVDVHAIMDDISLTGDARELSVAVPVMITELAKVGLRINLKKSVVLNCPELAARLGIPAVDGAKILGAWIGDDGKCEEFLDKQLSKCKPFFALTAKLAPEIALPVLSRCGVPRSNYLLRTHLPDHTKKFAINFDDMTLAALAAILRVPLEQIRREEVIRCIHLPLAMGGLGITAAAFIAPFAYDASVNADVEGAETQKSLTSQLNKTIIGSLPEELVAHLKLGENAGWIYSMQPNPHYGQGILLQVTGHSDVVCVCSCGHRSTQRELALHALGCTKVHGPNVSSRHAAVKSTIINFCKRNGIAISDEPVVYHDGISTKRCDIRLVLPTEDVYVDVTIANAACKTHAGKPLSTIERNKMREKEASYLEHVAALNGHLVTFVAEARGTLAPAALHLCKRLDALQIVKQKGHIAKEIQTALARANGSILTNVLRPLLRFRA